MKMTHKWNCIDDNGWLPNTSCTGGWQAHQDPYYRWGRFSSYDAVYHEDNDKYWYDFKRSWRASGWSGWVWNDQQRASHKFTWSGSSCRF